MVATPPPRPSAVVLISLRAIWKWFSPWPAGSSNSYQPAVRQQWWFQPCRLAAALVTPMPSGHGGYPPAAQQHWWLPPGRPAAMVVSAQPSGSGCYRPGVPEVVVSALPSGSYGFNQAIRHQWYSPPGRPEVVVAPPSLYGCGSYPPSGSGGLNLAFCGSVSGSVWLP